MKFINSGFPYYHIYYQINKENEYLWIKHGS